MFNISVPTYINIIMWFTIIFIRVDNIGLKFIFWDFIIYLPIKNINNTYTKNTKSVGILLFIM